MPKDQVIDNCFYCTKEKVGWTISDLKYIRHNLSLCQECARFIDEKIGKEPKPEPPAIEVAPFVPPKDVYNPPNFQDKEPEERPIPPKAESATAEIKKEPIKYRLKTPPYEREPGEEG